MSRVQNITLNGIHNQRLDNFLNSKYKNVPKSHLYKMIRQGQIRVNKKRVKPMNKINDGDIVRLPPIFSDEQSTQPKVAWKLPQSNILYDSSEILVIDKPVGLAVHSGSNTNWGLIDVLTAQYSSEYKLVHRLDKDTSGAMLVAKDHKMAKYCHQVIAQREVDKGYVLVAHGFVEKSKFTISKELEGKEAVTKFQVLKSNKDFSLLKANLVTGRKHQIRLHVKEFSQGIVGDTKYGYKQKQYPRLMLHASYVKFPLPSGRDLIINCSYPNSFNEYVK